MHHTFQRAARAARKPVCVLDAVAGPMLRLKTGAAELDLRTHSADLMCPPGSTPSRVKANARDARTLGLATERDLDARRSAVLPSGEPPLKHLSMARYRSMLGYRF